ncbi:MAG TPA: C40 family peptidase [Chitinophagaceae bacterium]|nr:C40 family peptidase [Chitinophagaceae bacterium]
MVRGSTFYALVFVSVLLTSCKDKNDVPFGDRASNTDQVDSSTTDSNNSFDLDKEIDSSITIVALPDPTIYQQGAEIKTGLTEPDSLVAFGKSLVGTPYLYASSDPAKGFDCSGFITYVFNHFGIAVPRSSVDFTNVGKEIPIAIARPGDLILFTGTDSTIRIVGHMGIVESNEKGNLLFIHSTSGKAKSVVITPLKGYYEARFVKVIRVFPDRYFR